MQEPVALSPTEQRLFDAFEVSEGIALSRHTLMLHIWPHTNRKAIEEKASSSRMVDVYVGYLRRKFRSRGIEIQTVRGYGYKLIKKINFMEETPVETNKAMDFMRVEDLINRQLTDIDKKRDEVKLLKATFEDAFKNDMKYRELDDKAKEAAKLRTQYKQAMMKDPAIAQANTQYLNGKEELKDMQIALSDYLKEYKRISGLTQFETQDGQILAIEEYFKLVRK